MTKFSANLGFLWADRPLGDAIRAAHQAGFDAVECHWPFDETPADIKSVLSETGLHMLGLNTRRGDVATGDNGLSAIPGRETEARAAIDEAISFAREIGTPNNHVMAGVAEGARARETFVNNLSYACSTAAQFGITILIEPLNAHDAPGYFLSDTGLAAEIIKEVAAPNLRLMFDCYHVARAEGDVITHLEALLPIIGHIQFAGVPERGRPDQGSLDYREIFAKIRALGWSKPLGAEYKPGGSTDETLGWMKTLCG